MKHRMKVSIKQTKKMKKLRLASQRIDLTLEMTFSVDNTPESASKAMGVMAKHLVEHGSLLHQYLDTKGVEARYIEMDGRLYEIEPSCFTCSHADPVQLENDNVICDLGNHCDFCSHHEMRKK